MVKHPYIVPLVLILGSLFLWNESLSISSSFTQGGTVGPAFFPRVALTGLIAVGLIELGHALWNRAAANEPRASAVVDAPGFYWWDLVATVAIGSLYVGLMRIIGFIPATVLFQAAMLLVPFRQRSMKIVIGAPLALTFFYFVIFIRLMGMPLPQGYGIFRTFSQLVYY